MGKTRDLFKKIRAIKGRFNANMGTIKDRKGMEQKQKIIRRGGKEIPKNCSTKVFMTQITAML